MSLLRLILHKPLIAIMAMLMLPVAHADRIQNLAEALGLSDTINVIQNQESQRDPKCAATASRLEDFMYGTPLTDQARYYQVARQKHFIRTVWEAADRLAAARNDTHVRAQDIALATQPYVQTELRTNGDILVRLMDKYSMLLERRDIRQYGSVAYALRAILSTQQDISIEEDQKLLPLDAQAVSELKRIVDLATLALLKRADHEARQLNDYRLTASHLDGVWGKAFGALPEKNKSTQEIKTGSSTDFATLRNIIKQKVQFYQAYNNIATPVFLRNIQVYFARHPWPKDEQKSHALKANYNQALIYYAVDLY